MLLLLPMIDLPSVLVYLFLITWFAVSLVYGLDKKLLGKYRKPLKGAGLVNEWSMFTRFSEKSTNYILLYKEKESKEWLPVFRKEPFNIFSLDRQFRFFVQNRLKFVVKADKKGVAYNDQTSYHYLCESIIEYYKLHANTIFKIEVVENTNIQTP